MYNSSVMVIWSKDFFFQLYFLKTQLNDVHLWKIILTKKKSGLECKLCVGVCLDDTVAIVWKHSG